MWNATLLRRVLPSPKDSTPYPFETARDSNREIWTRPLPLRPTQQQTRVNRIYQPVRLYQHSPRTETIYSSFNHSYISFVLDQASLIQSWPFSENRHTPHVHYLSAAATRDETVAEQWRSSACAACQTKRRVVDVPPFFTSCGTTPFR